VKVSLWSVSYGVPRDPAKPLGPQSTEHCYCACETIDEALALVRTKSPHAKIHGAQRRASGHELLVPEMQP
jgi:hypothetical protein